MYESNIYINNYNEVNQYPGDIGVPELMSRNGRDLLGI
jgi:hypothetical protein